MDNFSNEWTKEIDRLKNAMQIADQCLIAAADKAGILYIGCDTPDALADRILELELFARGW